MLFNAIMLMLENRYQSELPNIMKAIIKAQDYYEDSWDSNNNKYTLSHLKCAKKVVKEYKLPEEFIFIISDLNYFAWNDIQYIALEYLKDMNS